MIVIVSKYLIPKGFYGFAVYPFVLIKYRISKKDLVLLNHEKIHLRQQLELLILPFFIWYLLEFFVRYFQLRNWKLAYKNISFERESYQNETNTAYLEKRVFFNFINYL